MPPVIILDSDDDEDDIGYSPPRNIQASVSPVRAEVEAASDSFARVSGATTSTDPSFFQNIYNEQNDAARGFVPDPTAGSHDQDQRSVSSSDMTAPAPFKRTVTGLVETSSSSTRDQGNAGLQRMSDENAADEWTQASTPGRRKAPMAVMDDPWDVPSSPDERPAKPRIKIKLKRSGAHSDSATDSPYAQELNSVAKAQESKSERPDASPANDRKRRKVQHPGASFQGSNEVDLVTIPFNHDHEGGNHEFQPPPTPSMLPPTMPVDEGASFFIAPNPLTDTQKLEYESVQLPSSYSQNHQLPPVRQFNIQNLASSGEATNVNTPRSNATYLMSTAPPPPASSVMDLPRATIGRPTGQQWDSSPDVIAAIDSPPREKATKPQEQARRGAAPELADDEFVELQQTEQADLPIIQETASDNYDSEKMAKPTKAKKSRGRPKKKAHAKEDVAVTDPLEALPGVDGSVTKTKKKRGRPRKSDQVNAKEESLKLDPSLSTNDASLSEDAVQSEKRTKVEIEETETKVELAEDEDTNDSFKADGPDSPAIKETDPNLSTRSISSMDDNATSKTSDAPATKEEKSEKTTIGSRGSTPSKGLSSIINKPVYRVGLSKKSRIAPLLKCLRKE
ncbi:uncharacterized protein B0J16DRAFT_345168 [Fusarium flagelliforme]|uniref:AT hook domain-containing protein n=1 Tax=Fusarium flagelliforme TaxID=2675880 RepID=A0A395M8B2_9HYPO|nr:uncharacterized protein B0J16DRAFT_345168 [Fusarium flagelliforme]KAH7183021.1 hypothetical protein B0J16DRAFT_345168 [Fusarium flagelliforme]RFN44147.1 hypothetical protein FIE12Z_11614 [Fusarium flagelliforme]